MFKKSTVDAEIMQFSERREGNYMFVLKGGKLVCALCYKADAVLRNIIYGGTSTTKYTNLRQQEKQQKVQEIRGSSVIP